MMPPAHPTASSTLDHLWSMASMSQAGCPGGDSTIRSISPVSLPEELANKTLSRMSVEDVCNAVRQVDGLMPGRIDTYCDAIASQNISGAVLAHCSIPELKSVLNMNFGDWEIFQQIVVSMREAERRQKMAARSEQHPPPPLASNANAHHHQVAAKSSNKANPNASVPPAATSSAESTPVSRAVSSAAEHAINMEEALISGLLSTLNEEAQEDVITEELMKGGGASKERGPTQSGVGDSTERVNASDRDTDVIYLARSSRVDPRGDTMTASVGSEDAFNALEKASLVGRSLTSSVSDISSVKGQQLQQPVPPASLAIGGGSYNSAKVGSFSDVGMDSLPTSPTKSVTSTTQMNSGRPMASTGKSPQQQKQRHMRDRLESLTESLHMVKLEKKRKEDATANSPSLDDLGLGADAGKSEDNEEEEDAYAWLQRQSQDGPGDNDYGQGWISQTAPSSPLRGRSRAASECRYTEEPATRGNMMMAAASGGLTISVERIGDKVKKKLKHAMHKMEQPNALPPVHRPRESGDGPSSMSSRLRKMTSSVRSEGRKLGMIVFRS